MITDEGVPTKYILLIGVLGPVECTKDPSGNKFLLKSLMEVTRQ